MSDPDVEVGVDPRAGKDAREFARRAGTRLGHRHGSKVPMLGQLAVEGAQKRTAAALEMLPGILAVEDDRDERLFPAGSQAVVTARFRQALQEMTGGGFGVP